MDIAGGKDQRVGMKHSKKIQYFSHSKGSGILTLFTFIIFLSGFLIFATTYIL